MGSTDVVYRPGDSVLYWQPLQPGHVRAPEDEPDRGEDYKVDREVLTSAPGKWKLRWTGPHKVLRRTGRNTYDIRDGRSDLILSGVHVDTLHHFNPWSDEQPSTSPEIDRVLPWKFGGPVAEGNMLAVCMHGGAFAIGKLVRMRKGGRPVWQWYGNAKELWAPLQTTFKPGWLDAWDRKYYGPQRGEKDKPFLANERGNVSLDDIIMHGFSLTDKARLPANVRRALVRARAQLADR